MRRFSHLCYVRLESKGTWKGQIYFRGFIPSSSNHLTGAACVASGLLVPQETSSEVDERRGGWGPNHIINDHQSVQPQSLCNFWGLSARIQDTAGKKTKHHLNWMSSSLLHSHWLFYPGKLSFFFGGGTMFGSANPEHARCKWLGVLSWPFARFASCCRRTGFVKLRDMGAGNGWTWLY